MLPNYANFNPFCDNFRVFLLIEIKMCRIEETAMEIVILSSNKELEKSLLPVLDEIIYDRRLRNLALFSDSVFPVDPGKQLPSDHIFYFLLDISSLENAYKAGKLLQNNYPYSLLGLITDNDCSYCRLCNRLYPLFGHINLTDDDWIIETRILMQSLNQRILRTDDGILITSHKERIIVPYREIDYIETLKGSHYCNIYKSDLNTYTIRANIKDLLTLMDERFYLVRSSTIANLSSVSRLSQKERLLYFKSGRFCQYAQANYPQILKRLEALRT